MSTSTREQFSDWFQGRFMRRDGGKKIYVVSGSPGSGKTRYVLAHKGAGDIVVDMDYLCAALQGSGELYGDHAPVLGAALKAREAVLEELRTGRGRWENAYVITAEPRRAEVQRLADGLRAELVTMDASLDDCIRNIRGDERRQDKEAFERLASDWFAAQEDAG